MRVDCHQHFWELSRGDYSWMGPELGPIYRDFFPIDLDPMRQAAKIDKTIIVQAADTLAETDFILEIAGKTEWIGGVVGWVDMEHPKAIEDLTRLARNPLFKGIRPMIQEIQDDDWILRPTLDRVFDALIDLDLGFDALVLPRHLANLQIRLEKHPNLRCVINHAAKPALASKNISLWKADIDRIANSTGAFCKFSGFLTEAGDTPTQTAIAPAANHVLTAFEAQRIMFASDWPVLNLASDYATWLGMAEALTSHLNKPARQRIFGETAAEFYRL